MTAKADYATNGAFVDRHRILAARVHPLEADGPNGTRIRGRIDLLVEAKDGWILLDHKSNPGGAARDEDLVAEHGPQLESYSQALLSATGKPVTERWLYLPVAARAVRLS